MTAAADFWSKRKAAVQAEAEAERAAVEATRQDAALQELEEKTDGEILEELELPDPDELEMGDDFKAFMGKAVPERIRRRALRKLWLTNPALANLDGLIEYGEDYTDSATVIENLQTAYQVGKGMLKHIEALAESDGDEETTAISEDDVEPAADEIEAIPELIENEPEYSVAEISSDYAEANSEDEIAYHEKPVAMRRMRFSFSGADGVSVNQEAER